ncbi:MAG: sugar phosphate isomerase/epimerase family protein [Nitrosotalea sp.]
MEGRLSDPIGNEIQSFPRYSWKKEFEQAARCGFDLIEWVFDLYENNPILDNVGVNEIKNLSQKHGIYVNAVCADYFMKKMLFNVSDFELERNLTVLRRLIEKCRVLDIKILEIPLVDDSSLKSKNDEEQLIHNLEKILPVAKENGVELTLETDLPTHSFKELLEKFNHPNIKANYDTGNSTALGYNIKEELEVLKSWITNVHIKDRIYKGKSVPLGTGNTDFETFFSILAKINYNGSLIIQGAREINNNVISPEFTCKKYLEFVKQYVDKYFTISS